MAVAASIALALALLLVGKGEQGVQASHAGGMDLMAIDMDPTVSPANHPTSLGTRETCAQINENNVTDADEESVDAVQIDITATNIPATTAMIGFLFQLNYSEANLSLQAQSASVGVSLLGANLGSNVLDASDPAPDIDGNGYWAAAVADVSNTNLIPPESGTGRLMRLDLSSDAGAATASYPLTLTGAVHVDSTNIAYLADAVAGASIALNMACPGATPPANNNLASALEIGFQPYTNVQSNLGATAEGGERTTFGPTAVPPTGGCEGAFPNTLMSATVWYKYSHTEADETLQLDTIGSAIDTVVAIYEGPPSGPTFPSLGLIDCADQSFSSNDAGLTFTAELGKTYYIQVGAYAFLSGGRIALNLSHVVSTAGAVYVVNTTSDISDPTPDGTCGLPCSFREAIQEANANPGTDNIRFNLSGSTTIAPATAYPPMTSPVVIDARTQPWFVGAPVVRLNALSGSFDGPVINSGASNSSIRGLAFSFYGPNVTFSQADGSVLQGNYVGTDLSGTVDAGSAADGVVIFNGDGNTIGGTTEAARNVISGNNGAGLEIQATLTNSANFNIVAGNYIGTDASGKLDLGNTAEGVLIDATGSASAFQNFIGQSVAGSGNVISGNSKTGVTVSGSAFSNVLIANRIGLSATGSTLIGNSSHGVLIQDASSNQVVGGSNSTPNEIAGNGEAGIKVQGTSATGNRLSSHIYDNAGLGIDLHPTGVNANDLGDTDTGPNRLQNYPVISSAGTANGITRVIGTLNAEPSGQITIEFYSNTACDGTNGEGRQRVGAYTAGIPSGNLSFSVEFGTLVPVGQFITAVAINNTEDSSEFSVCRIVTTDTDGDGVDDAAEGQCGNASDDDGDTYVNDACPQVGGTLESGGQCSNALDDDGDGWINDGCPGHSETNACGSDNTNTAKRPERIDGVFAGVSDDGDVAIDEALPPGAEGYDCDGDGFTGAAEFGTPMCGNGKNDDGVSPMSDDGVVDDGCPGGPLQVGTRSPRRSSRSGHPTRIPAAPTAGPSSSSPAPAA